jgi:SAM-dependent methyltransferase
MRLPARPACFACTSSGKSAIGSLPEVVLMRCTSCGAQWLEGTIAGEQAYRYSHADDLDDRYLQGRARRFATWLQRVSPRPGQLLDVGCATGAFLAASAGLGWRPTGIELTEEVAELARRKTHLPVLAGDLTHGELFEPNSFDVISLWGVLEHVPHPDQLLLACSHLLRTRGYLLLETPNASALFRLIARQMLRLSRSQFEAPFRETLSAGHVAWYSSRALRVAADRLRLRVLQLRGSRNSTEMLLARWADKPTLARLAFQSGTAALNYAAAPIGRPNQLIATLQYVDAK